MHKKKLSLIITLTLTLTVACLVGSPATQTPTFPIIPTGHLSEPEALHTLATNPPSPEPDQPSASRPSYSLSVQFDYQNHTLEVVENIQYPNLYTEPLEELLLVVEPMRLTGDFEIQSFTWGSSGEDIEDYRIEERLIFIPLDAPLLPGEIISLEITFSYTLPEAGGVFGYTDRQVVLMNWYPLIPPYREGQGWLVNEPWIVGDHMVYQTSDFSVQISVDYLGLVLAGPSVPAVKGQTYSYTLEAARTFAWAASPEFKIQSTETLGIPVVSYSFPEHTEAGRQAMEMSAQSIALFSGLFSPCPSKNLSIVEIDYHDGMESDGIYFIGEPYYEDYDGTPQNYLTLLAIHETSHQWWFSLVGNDQANEPWVDEIPATYSELMFIELVYPELVDWWWWYRVERWDLYWPVGEPIYAYGDYFAYVNGVYLLGVKFLHAIQNEMGSESFIAALREYLAVGQYKIMTGDEFLAILQSHSPTDLNSIIETYLDNH